MSTESRVLWTQVLGLIAIILARFGIELDAQAQADILAGLSAFGLLLTALLAKTKPAVTNEFSPSDEAGRAQPWLLSVLAVVGGAVLLLQLAACAGQVRPNNAIAAASQSIRALVVEVGIAQQLGQITVEHEDALLNRLQQANDTLRQVQRLVVSCHSDPSAVCSEPEQLLISISAELTHLRVELAKAQESQP